MLPLVFFLTDLISHAIFDRQVVSALFVYLVYRGFFKKIDFKIYFSVALLFLQDVVFYDRIGFSLFIILPLFLLVVLTKRFVQRYWWEFLSLFFITLALTIDFFVKNWFFTPGCSIESILIRISSSIVIMTLIFFGTRGNRFSP